jgi:hypothetical protein
MTVRRKSQVLIPIALILVAIAAWAAVDLWGRHSTSLRQFDPDDVARLETEMWRSYYAKERLRLFNELAVLLRHQYHMPLLRSYVVAFHAAKAAFVFKDGTGRSDYERALPDLVDYYSAIRRISNEPFDVRKTATLELEWWIVHRQRNLYATGDLDAALAELAAEIYQMPADRFREHAKYRAEAMVLRDDLAEQNRVTDADWQKINQLLLQSWRSLWQSVNPDIHQSQVAR